MCKLLIHRRGWKETTTSMVLIKVRQERQNLLSLKRGLFRLHWHKMFCAVSVRSYNYIVNEQWFVWWFAVRHHYRVSTLPILEPFMLYSFWDTQSPTHPHPSLEAGCSQTPTLAPVPSQHVCFFWCLSVCLCVWAAVFSSVLTTQLRLTDGIISHTDRKAGYRKPGCVNSPGAAVVGINLGQWRLAHGESASGASLAFP